MSNGSFARQANKQRNGRGSNGVDRISELPEALIIHILSLLPTSKHRIRTEVLSRRWKDLWTCVPKLDLEWYYDPEPDDDNEDDDEDDEDEVYRELNDFVNRVDKTLNRILSSGTEVEEFRVKLSYFDYYSHKVDELVRLAAKNETEVFELDFELHDADGISYELPSHIYTNSYFRELRFNNCDFVICETVSWDSLKKLTIESESRTFFNDEALENIVAGAPKLEFLDLQLGPGISKLDFSNSVLKKLVLHIEAAIEITAPSVESLKISGCFRTCKLFDMASLVEATLFGMPVKGDFDYPILTEEVVSSLLNVKTLTVGTWVIQGIATLRKSGGCPWFPECKCLTVDTHLWKEDPSAIARLLKNTPQVETMIATICDSEDTISDSEDEFLPDSPSGHGISNVDQFWASHGMASNYLTSLRTVKFVGFWGHRTVAFPFVQFVLKNAPRLQKIIIDLEAEAILHIAQTELVETFRKLLSYPRSSRDAKLLINP